MPPKKKKEWPQAPFTAEHMSNVFNNWDWMLKWKERREEIWKEGMGPVHEAFQWLEETKQGLINPSSLIADTTASETNKDETPTQKRTTRNARLHRIAAEKREAEEAVTTAARRAATTAACRPLFPESQADEQENEEEDEEEEEVEGGDAEQPVEGDDNTPLKANATEGETQPPDASANVDYKSVAEELSPTSPSPPKRPKRGTEIVSTPVVVDASSADENSTPPMQTPPQASVEVVEETPINSKPVTPPTVKTRSATAVSRVTLTVPAASSSKVVHSPRLAVTPTLTAPNHASSTKAAKTAPFTRLGQATKGTPIQMDLHDANKHNAAIAKKNKILAERAEAAKKNVERVEKVKAQRLAQEEKRNAELIAKMKEKDNKAMNRAHSPLKTTATVSTPTKSVRATPAKANLKPTAKGVRQYRLEQRIRAEEMRREKEVQEKAEQEAEKQRLKARQAANAKKKPKGKRAPTPPASPPQALRPIIKPAQFQPPPVSAPSPIKEQEEKGEAQMVLCDSQDSVDSAHPPEDPSHAPDPSPQPPSDAKSATEEEEDVPPPTKKPKRDTLDRNPPKSSSAKKNLSKSKSPAAATRESYDMTPLRQPQPSTAENYNIDDLNSGDETDDESDPRKKIPDWAQGQNLKASIIRQYYTNVNPRTIFGPTYAPILHLMFSQTRRRFHKRTSSAIWDSPLLAPPPKKSHHAAQLHS